MHLHFYARQHIVLSAY